MPQARLRPAVGVKSHALEGEAVLFDQESQRMFHLNSTAACVWNCIQQGGEPALAARDIAAGLHIDQATALAYVQEMVERWRDLDVLDNGQPKRKQRTRRPPGLAGSGGGGRLAHFAAACHRHYMVLGTLVSLSFHEKSLEETVHPTLCHLEATPSRPPDVCVDLVSTATGYEVRCNGDLLGSCVGSSGVAPLVNAHVFQLAIRRLPHVMALHAGALARSQGCLLMPAKSGSGKSTLTAALCRAGWRYMTDDIVLLQRGSLSAVGVPNPLGIKSGAWNILETLYPELIGATTHHRDDGKRIRYVTPPGWANSEGTAGTSARWIIFPRHESNVSAAMTSLSSAKGFCRLMEHCCGLPSNLTQQDVDEMIRWIGEIACFELTFSDLDEAVRTISAHCVQPLSDE